MSQRPAALPAQPNDSHRRQRHTDLRRWRRPAVVFGAAIVVLLAVGIILLARQWPFSSDRVAQSLQEDFHGAVSFAQLNSIYFPHPGCVAEGLTLMSPSSTPGSPPLVHVQRFARHAAYSDLLLRPGYISNVVLEGLRIRIPPRGTKAQPSGLATPQQEPSIIKSVFLKPLDTIFKKETKGAIIPVKMDGTYSDPHPGIALGADTKNTKDKGKSSDRNKQ